MEEKNKQLRKKPENLKKKQYKNVSEQTSERKCGEKDENRKYLTAKFNSKDRKKRKSLQTAYQKYKDENLKLKKELVAQRRKTKMLQTQCTHLKDEVSKVKKRSYSVRKRKEYRRKQSVIRNKTHRIYTNNVGRR